MITILIVGGGIGLVLLIVGVIVNSSYQKTFVDDRINKYLEEAQKKDEDTESKQPIGDWVNRRVEKTTFGERIARDLARKLSRCHPERPWSIRLERRSALFSYLVCRSH